MACRSRFIALLAALLCVPFSVSRPQEGTEPQRYRVPRSTSAIRVDGLLDEAAWRAAVQVELEFEVRPAENKPPPVRTLCFLLYDSSHFYIGFRADDPEPSRIRAHYSDRDTAWFDDFVGVVLDTFNDRRRAFAFYSNPLGVQIDQIETDTGHGFDSSWDAIWDSSGRITPRGYTVEMAIPWSSLRFGKERGDKVFAFDLVRGYPREVSHHIGVFPRDRSLNCYLCQAWELVGFSGVSPGLNLEFDPTVTVLRGDKRLDFPDGSVERGDVDVDPGLSARWGMTPNLSLNGALNPDFSQVEADVAQLDVNERFDLFYEEKRPFFLEGADYFTTPFRVVHTRMVVDPSWGMKLTGKEDANAIGAFVARDERPTLLVPGSQRSQLYLLEDDVTAAVARWRRDVGANSTIGLLATDRRGGDYRSSVYGADGQLRISQHDIIQFQLLRSDAEYPEGIPVEDSRPDGTAMSILYEHDTRNWSEWIDYVDISAGFSADLGFIPRVDLREIEAGVRRRWWGDEDRWYSKAMLTLMGMRTEGHDGLLTDQSFSFVFDYEGTKQSRLHFHPTFNKEYYDGDSDDLSDGRLYDLDGGHFSCGMQPTGDMAIELFGAWGGAVDYANEQPADQLRIGSEIAYRFGRHLSVTLRHELERLRVEAGRLYEARLTQSRIVYQFNRRTFLRAIFQYLDVERNAAVYLEEVEESERHLFTQLLFSYKINPQTVFFLGYSDNRLGDQAVDLTLADRTLFLKLGYAWLP
jgi:hypothetical protein